MEALPSPLSSRVDTGPFGSPKEMKNTFRPATALRGSVAVPFVIPSEAEGSVVLQARLGRVVRGSGLGFEARRADRQTSAQPGRAGSSIVRTGHMVDTLDRAHG
jgi:hypothetical protein